MFGKVTQKLGWALVGEKGKNEFADSVAHSLDQFWYGPADGLMSSSGINVSALSSLKASAVFCCVNKKSNSIASLGLHVYERLGNNQRRKAKDHPLYRLLHSKPNSTQSHFNFFHTLQVHRELRGNFYAFINTDRRGQVVSLETLHPDKMRVKSEDGRVVYDYTDGGETQRFPASKILHVKGMSDDGLVGLSPIAYARNTIGNGLGAEDYASRLLKNDARSTVSLEYPHPLGKTKEERYEMIQKIRQDYMQKQTGANRGMPVVVDDGAKVSQLSISPQDAQFLESRQFGVVDVCRFLNMPPHKAFDLTNAHFTNIQESNIDYVVDSIMPETTNIEEALTLALIPEKDQGRYFVEFDLNSLLRGKLEEQFAAFKDGILGGWLSKNDVRRMLNMNDIEGGDEYIEPMNMVTTTNRQKSANADIFKKAISMGVPVSAKDVYDPLGLKKPASDGEDNLQFDDRNIREYHIKFGLFEINEVRKMFGFEPKPWGNVPTRSLEGIGVEGGVDTPAGSSGSGGGDKSENEGEAESENDELSVQPAGDILNGDLAKRNGNGSHAETI